MAVNECKTKYMLLTNRGIYLSMMSVEIKNRITLANVDLLQLVSIGSIVV